MLQSVLEDFYDYFKHLMGDTINYIKQRFATCKEPLLCEFVVSWELVVKQFGWLWIKDNK